MNEKKSSLQLGKIVLKNFKTYKGETIIELSRDLNKTITVIHGEMGRGKTTLLGAIYWCLYGESKSTDMESDEGILNTDVLQNLKINDYDETIVEINLYEEDELRYKIRRVMEFSKKSESENLIQNSVIGGRIPSGIVLVEKSTLSHLPPESDWKSYNDSERIKNVIDSILPKSLSKYFLFDAELLDNFFDTSDQKNVTVKDGIEKISGLPIIENSIKHLKKTSDEIEKSIKDVITEPLQNEKALLERKEKSLIDSISDETANQEKFQRDIDTLESFLRTHNEETITSTQSRIDELTLDIKNNKGRLADHNKKMNGWILRSNILARLNDSMRKSLTKCDNWEKEGKIPIAVSGLALRNILEGNPPVCICGAHLDEGSKEREHIQKLLEKNLIESPIIQNITIGRGHWDNLTSETQESFNTLQTFKSKRDQFNEYHSKKDAQRKSEGKKFENMNLDDIHKKFTELGNLRNQLSSSLQTLGAYKAELTRVQRNLELQKRKLDAARRKQDKYTSQNNRIDLANTLEKLFKKYRDELVEELRTMVSQRTLEYFLKLVSRKEDFKSVKIQENYKTSVLDGNLKNKSLSAGQSCCLALSFIAAIRDISEKNYFMVIDSPLHNISQEERVDIAKNLPKFLPQTQITLLVQDQEYTGRAKKAITGDEIPSVRETLMTNNSIWREYVLKTIKEKGNASHTVINEVEL